MTVTYTLEKPTTGMTFFTDTSFLVKLDATASSFLARTTGKLEFAGELNATLAGATLNLNAPAVVAIKAVVAAEFKWHNNHFVSGHTLAAAEAATLASAMQQTQTCLDNIETGLTSIASKVSNLANHEATLSAYTVMMED
ncbi:MAG: hypothetical protein J0H82_10510 [Alphaproteobacteria bacterium]|jgi:hypothetical protein|nr:hypothetical protein [Alphaproteobacteria bacterium]